MVANGAAVGASAAVIGTVVGLLAWIAFVPTLQSISEHRINRFALPWWAIGAAMVLTFATAVVAAWWPARTVARIPVVAALSGRPPRPQPAHRFAALGGVSLGAGLILLAFADQRRAGFIIAGTIATVVGLLLLAPLAIRAVGSTGRRSPVSVRLAVRDLARYQARSGAALGAITLALGIAATIAISAAAASPTKSTAGNLPSNQMMLYLTAGGPGNPIPPTTLAQRQALQARVNQLAGVLHAQSVLPLDEAFDPQSGLQAAPPGQGPREGYVTASMSQVTSAGRGESITMEDVLYVATPEVLAYYRIPASAISSTADIITSQTGLGGLQIFDPGQRFGAGGPGQSRPSSSPQSTTATKPSIQILKQLGTYTSDPTTLITTHAMQTLGLQALPAGWLIETPHALTTGDIDTAQKAAATAGLYVETRTTQKSTAALRNWSTAAGILLALGVLGMAIGLIRSETANDLRILTATGATSTTRRSLTGATAGALAFLGAVLGIAGAYLALLAWHRSHLTPLGQVPVGNLVMILIGLPLIAAVGGWLLGGRQPPALARRPLD
jgi:putative ABC transport system permease protein